ncbi:hypothetical protein [Phyllobacterium sp. SB3]|uniref:hypothetical protein n=1 Tax=Phyllobacterium sp. SB3 TaxID=3156073 RepID=UPI0032AF5EF9
MTTLNTYEFNTATPEQGSHPITVSINPHNFSPAGRRRKGQSTTRHLLIGFDTEYQSFNVTAEQIKDRKARNEVLSYQYCVKLIDANSQPADPPISVSGIIIPDEDKRWFLDDFIAASLGDLVGKNPDIVLPKDVYLIGHFTRADLPAFEGFADHARNLLSNVRSTFVSIDASQKLTICDNQNNDLGTLNVRMRDTILLAPANAKSLAAIGDILGFEKFSLADDAATELHIKENMKEYRRTNWPEFRDYAIRDAEICVAYAERIIRQNHQLFGEFKMPVTLTSFGRKLVWQGWEEKGLDPYQIVGKEKVDTKQYKKKLGYFISDTETPFLPKVHFKQAFITECFHGGRNEQYHFGIADEGEWKDIDLSSAYPTAMSLIGTPDWESVREVYSIDDFKLDDLGYAWVEFEFPASARFPTLPVRTAHGIIFPRKGESYCAAPEIYLARKLGATLTVKTAVVVDTDKKNPVFADFNRDCIERRNAFGKGTFDNLFWKEVGNSTYGKTAQGLKEKRVYDLKSDDMVELPASELTQPFFAAFITSYTRAVLGEILNRFPPSVKVFSATTDGLLTTASQAQIDKASTGALVKSFGAARQKLVGNDTSLEIKHQIRQPLGWRTRGSATLKKGFGKDAIVLQKGGLKTNILFDDDQQNNHVVELFFNRYPEQKLEYTSGIGIKDMVRFETDFVFKDVSKRVSMEFDWKRRPIQPSDKSVVFNGKTYTHLSYETAPLEDAEEFKKARNAWEKYDSKSHSCLKTKSDFDNFNTYLQTNSTPDRQRAKYVSRQAGDMKRLRRDLCRAFKHSLAGFDREIEIQGKISHASFMSALADCGIECKDSDLDNGKRAEFKPNQSFRTEKAMQAIQMLKQNHYPQLDIDILMEPE